MLDIYPNVIEKIKIPTQIKPLHLYYMFHNEIYTIIDIDERKKIVEVFNYVNDDIYKAFVKKRKNKF